MFSARQVLRSTCFDLLRGGIENVTAGEVVPPSKSGSRLGLVVPKRLARHAVLRNAIKRQAREAFRHHSESLPALDLVLRLARWPKDMAALTATPQALKCSVRQEIELLLEKLKRRVAPVSASTEEHV